MKNQDLLMLLKKMGSNGRAESEDSERFCQMFYPPKEQLGALDPDVSLVLGPRGSGKTALFRAVTEFGLAKALADLNSKARIPAMAEWHSVELHRSTEVPTQAHLKRFFADPSLSSNVADDFWQCILVRSVWDKLDARAHSELHAMKAVDATTSAIAEVGGAHSESAALALDRLNDQLAGEERILFVAFDELDRIVSHIGRAASTLVAFWASRWRRWKGIRAKLFLRSDIYRRFVVEGGADLAKISANRFELSWSDESLMAMLVKRILNTDPEGWKKALNLRKRDVVQLGALGTSLASDSLEDLHAVIHAILGPHMGANKKKGASEKWILEHIKDCQGNASPRSLVRMFELAAENQLAERYECAAMLDPAYVRQALTKVSENHVQSSLDEWPWLEGLQDRLRKWTTIRQMPMERKPFEVQLRKTWEQSWNANPELAGPPCDDPQGFVPMLIDAGILRERKDGKLETTDLYLDGLGFKRKGGVRRRIAKAVS